MADNVKPPVIVSSEFRRTLGPSPSLHMQLCAARTQHRSIKESTQDPLGAHIEIVLADNSNPLLYSVVNSFGVNHIGIFLK